MSFDPEKFKAEFPLFSYSENKGLVYLDNAATTQKPASVINAITEFYSRYNANAHRSSHRLALKTTELIEDSRRKVADFIGADPGEIIFTSGATESLNTLAFSLGDQLKDGDEVLLTLAEHHANLVPWQMLAIRKSIKLQFIAESHHRFDFSNLKQNLNDRTRIVSVTAASNVFGFKNAIENIKAQLPENVVFIVDASQALAHEKIDVKTIDCDYLFASAHKLFGPTGLGFLYAKKENLKKIKPVKFGGEMVSVVEQQSSEFVEGPQAFEAGTSSLAAIVGFGACMEFWQSLPRNEIQVYEQNLLEYCHKKIAEVSTLKVLSEPENNIGICSFVFSGGQYNEFDLVQYLNEKDIAVRLGHHCAQPLLAKHNLAAVVRVSLAPYNLFSDIDKLILAIHEFLELQRLDQSLADFTDFKNTHGWQAKYKMLMDWGKLHVVNPEIRIKENEVSGCESLAWLAYDTSLDGFTYDSDSRIVKGLMVLLDLMLKQYPDYSKSQIKNLYSELGLERHLSESRSNGFSALLDKAFTIKLQANKS